jgi:hypothetical protein
MPVVDTAIEKLAEKDGAGMNRFLAVAVAENAFELQTKAFFKERRERAAFLRILNRDGGAEPEADNALPEGTDAVLRERGAIP